MALPLSLFPIAELYVDSSVAGMINGSVPLFAAVIAAILLNVWPPRRQITGLLVGFAGVVLVIGLFAWVLVRAYAIGRQAAHLEQPFAALAAHGIGIWLGVQAFINIGVNMGLLPTKGLTLPLMSYGGSSLIVMCTAIGLILRVDRGTRTQRNWLEKEVSA